MQSRWRAPVLGAVGVLAATLVWELAVRAGVLPAQYFPPVTRILGSLWGSIGSGELLRELVATVSVWLRGFVMAAVVGIVAGVIIGASDLPYRATRVTFELLRPIPSAAIIPIAILLLGIGDSMRTAVIFYSTLWPVLFNTIYGIRSVEPGWVDAARTFGFTRREILFRVMLPGALPYVATGIRIGTSIALVVAITCEMIAGARGLGFYVSSMEMALRVPEMYGGILLAGLLGFVINATCLRLEQRYVGWQRSIAGG